MLAAIQVKKLIQVKTVAAIMEHFLFQQNHN